MDYTTPALGVYEQTHTLLLQCVFMRRQTYVSWVPKKKMGYLLAGGLTAPSGSSSI